jgi:O-antigen/teichoic acid export membrane protein
MSERSLTFRRVGWGVAGQAASTLTNFVGLALIARQVEAVEFGAVSVAFIVIAVAIAVGRGIWGEALLILGGRRPEARPCLATTALCGSIVLGGSIGIVLVLGGWLLPRPLGPLFVVAGIAMPFLLVQDASRYVFFGRARPDLAALSDLAWLVGSVTLLVVVSRGGSNPQVLMGAWLGGLIPALIVVLLLHGRIAARPAVGQWLKHERRVYLPLTGDIVGGAGTRAVAVLLLVTVVGFAEGGGFRAAQVLMGPITVLSLAAPPLFLARFSGASVQVLRPRLRTSALLLGGAGTVWVVIAASLPVAVGETLLGEAWTEASPIIPVVGALQVAAAVSLVPFLALRSQARTDLAFHLRVGSGAALIAAAAGGAVVGGAAGAATTMVLVEAATFLVGIRLVGLAARSQSRQGSHRQGNRNRHPDRVQPSSFGHHNESRVGP